MGHPAEGQQRVRGGHGRRAGRAHAATRSRYAAGLSGRNLEAIIAEPRAPVQMKARRPARFDYEYERNGMANLFMMFAPLEGWRHVKVTNRHTAVDYAHALKDLADIHFLNAKKIVLVQDNLNTHAKASLYEAFPAAEARRLAERFEWHYTWRSQNSGSSHPNASIDASRTHRSLSTKSQLGRTIEMPTTPRLIGS